MATIRGAGARQQVFAATLLAVATENPRPPRDLEPALPKALSELIVSLLAKDGARRPASAQAVAATFDDIAREVARPAPTKKTRQWWLGAGIAAALAAVLLGLWAGGVFRLRTPDGILVVEVNEANPDVFVDGDKMTVTWDKGGKPAVTDGPFTETKEVLGGYWIIQVKSREEAIEWAKRVPSRDARKIELRQIFEMTDFPADVQKAADNPEVRAMIERVEKSVRS